MARSYVLAFSLIMLNTDQHNASVKKKMTVQARRRGGQPHTPYNMLTTTYSIQHADNRRPFTA
jgi:hypothetical protein